MGPAMGLEGGTDRFVFEGYVERFLAPSLSAGQIVLLDDLSAHKTERVRELIEERGAEVWFLPSYSPDMNPIEEAFLEGEGAAEEGLRSHEGGAAFGHRGGVGGRDGRRCAGLVHPLRLPFEGSIVVSTAVRQR